MGYALVVFAVLLGVRVVFQLLADGWARPWAERYLAATARPEPKEGHQFHDPVWIITAKNEGVNMGQGQPDTTGAGVYRRPRWVCVAEGAPSWSSRQPTMDAARREAAEIMGVAESAITVEAWDNMLPSGESAEWINPIS